MGLLHLLLPLATLALPPNLTPSPFSDDSTTGFLGLQYGSAARFQAADLIPLSENDPIDASKFGSSCAQHDGEQLDKMKGSEDCLFLNVFAPTTASQTPLPVAVFVHGGTYYDGTSDDFPGFDVVKFWQTNDEPALLVTLNYRLNVFGFLGSEQLRLLDGSTGNLGIQDQRVAFEWVQENIERFGGDPARVTIFGESAGAGSMTAHMTMPNSFPFYSSVILESGSFSQWVAQPLSDAETTFQNVLTLTNCTTVSCLTALPAVTLFAAGANIPLPSPALYAPLGWAPTVDDVELKSHPWLLLKDGEVRYDIPVMLGSNKDEGSLFVTLTDNCTKEDLDLFWIEGGFKDVATLGEIYLNKEYPDTPERSEFWWAGMRSMGDFMFTCPTKYFGQHYSSDSYIYHYEHYVREMPNFVSHGAELPFVFHLDAALTDEDDEAMGDVMATYWGKFVRDGAPGGAWKVYDKAGDANIRGLVEKDEEHDLQGLKEDACEFFMAATTKRISETFDL